MKPVIIAVALAVTVTTVAGSGAQACGPRDIYHPLPCEDWLSNINPTAAQQRDQREAGGVGPYINPHGGARGGLCYGPYCGESETSIGGAGPYVNPHGGARGGICYGPYC